MNSGSAQLKTVQIIEVLRLDSSKVPLLLNFRFNRVESILNSGDKYRNITTSFKDPKHIYYRWYKSFLHSTYSSIYLHCVSVLQYIANNRMHKPQSATNYLLCKL